YDVLEFVLYMSQKKYGFEFPDLPHLVALSQDKPVITPSGFIAASHGKFLYELMREESVRPTNLQSVHYIAGRLFVSLMLYDGIIKKKTLEAMLASSRKGWREIDGELYFVDDTVQVFPCKVTRLWLNQYWLHQLSSHKSISFDRSIADFYAHHNLRIGKSAFTKLRQIARVALVLNLNPAAQSMAFGTLKYTPLPEHVLQRLIVSLPCSAINTVKPSSSMTHRNWRKWQNQIKMGYQDYEVSLESQLGQLKNTVLYPLSMVLQESCKPVANDIQNWLDENSNLTKMPWLWLIISWSWKLIIYGNVKKNLRVDTVRKYVNAIATPFLTEFSNTDPQKMDDDIWCEKLNNVIEQISNGQSKQYVHYFARYLSASGHFSTAVFENLDATSVNGRVDANLVVPKDVSYLLDYLRTLHGEIYDIARLILCMGFYSGLRRGEAGGLKTKDIDRWMSDVVLFVRRNHKRNLKSSSSRRNLYIHHLWPSQEIELLLLRLHKRGGRKEDLLFPDQDVLADAFDLITMLLKKVTGDHSLRFHHLRHGFANLIWLCLNRHSIKQIPDWLENSYQEYSTIAAAERIQKMLGVSAYGRKRLMVLSELLGHQHHATTVGSYIHIQSLLMPMLQHHIPSVRAYKAILGQACSSELHHDEECWEEALRCPEPSVVRVGVVPFSQIERAEIESPLTMTSVLQILHRLSQQETCAKIANDLSLSSRAVTGLRTLVRSLENTRVGNSKSKIQIIAMKQRDSKKANLIVRLADAFDRKIDPKISFCYVESAALLAHCTTPSKDWQIRTDDINSIQSFLKLLVWLGINKDHFKVKWFLPRLERLHGQERAELLLALRNEVYETLNEVKPENIEIRALEQQRHDIEVLNQGKVTDEGRFLSDKKIGIFALSVVRMKTYRGGGYHWFDNPRRSEVIPAFVQLIHLWSEARFAYYDSSDPGNTHLFKAFEEAKG
ncbi:hypothetical protein LRP50_00005, partial [Enterovibrio sp. ZSDZ42]